MSHREYRLRSGRLIAQAAAVFAFFTSVQPTSAAVLNTPVYNPHTKSYFELVRVRPDEEDRGTGGERWGSAQAHAQLHVFHGVRGRLAVLRDLDTTIWVEATFGQAGDTWIGLQYLCDKRQLQWSDGSYFKPGDFQLWEGNWWQGEGPPCPDSFPAPVELFKDASGVHWAAKNYAKVYEFYLMEFPTGQP